MTEQQLKDLTDRNTQWYNDHLQRERHNEETLSFRRFQKVYYGFIAGAGAVGILLAITDLAS